MKNHLKKGIGIAVLGIAMLTSPNYALCEQKYVVEPQKVEQIEQFIDQTIFGYHGINLGESTNLDDIRTCLIFTEDPLELKEENITITLSNKGAIGYPFGGKTEMVVIDLKNNGYGNVDSITIEKDGQEIELKNPTEEQMEKINGIYSIVLETFYDENLKPLIEKQEAAKKLEGLIKELKK